jgi:hypothetical protein
MYGDVSGDGKINSADAVLVMKASLRLITLTSAQETAADVNGDGKVNSADAVLIMKYSLRLISSFPVQ